MFTETEIQALVNKIVQRIQPEKVIVFGSYAKGTATYKSDLDLFVIKDTYLPPSSRALEVRPLLSQLLLKVDVHVYTPEEVEVYIAEQYSFVYSVMKTGKVWYDKSKAAV
ncbi:Predicted nucleotidyltransferase [Filimonas lacunae]|uniref:Predicted nucleotidyltransferase n=1 Tax=Filimonas lacunae TaxID=477680 RepID=A0A173MH71_9BACT|nr:nucleotidyltransferase domain-containing protein [Filimonas lacunae]BAV06839.1 nucleotidyltransferase domain protein [Filimonas lacunae]SIS99034.1 Predicted nucleotidyltransferase [Filimonas lacunae]